MRGLDPLQLVPLVKVATEKSDNLVYLVVKVLVERQIDTPIIHGLV